MISVLIFLLAAFCIGYALDEGGEEPLLLVAMSPLLCILSAVLMADFFVKKISTKKIERKK